MDIEIAKNAQSLMKKLNGFDSELNQLNKIKETGVCSGVLSFYLCDDCVIPVILNDNEISEVLNFLSSYWTLEKYKVMQEIEEL